MRDQTNVNRKRKSFGVLSGLILFITSLVIGYVCIALLWNTMSETIDEQQAPLERIAPDNTSSVVS